MATNPVSDIRRPDVRAVIRAVNSTSSSRIVPVADLYRVYSELMASQDRERVSPKMLGQALEQCGQRAISRWIDGKAVRCRVIHEKRMAPEEFDTEPARI